jgi:hypothetical protein
MSLEKTEEGGIQPEELTKAQIIGELVVDRRLCMKIDLAPSLRISICFMLDLKLHRKKIQDPYHHQRNLLYFLYVSRNQKQSSAKAQTGVGCFKNL